MYLSLTALGVLILITFMLGMLTTFILVLHALARYRK